MIIPYLFYLFLEIDAWWTDIYLFAMTGTGLSVYPGSHD